MPSNYRAFWTGNTNAAEAVERVNDAMWDEIGASAWASDGSVAVYEDEWCNMAAAAIQCHTSYLWERSREVEDELRAALFDYHAARRDYELMGVENGYGPDEALNDILVALLGPRPEGARDAD